MTVTSVAKGLSPEHHISINIKCRLCAVSNLFRVNLRFVYRYKTVTYEALMELSSKNLCKASSFVGKQGHFKCSCGANGFKPSDFQSGGAGSIPVGSTMNMGL